LSPRTVSNRWLAFMTFLKHFKITGLTTRKDAPKFVEEEPEAYTKEEMNTFLAACDERRRTLFRFFLMTGCREQEVMYATWPDIDLKEKTFRVRAKPEYGFRPKSWEERTVPLEPGLALALERLQKGLKRGNLVFPTRNRKPNTKMLVACKGVARKAKLDPEKFWLHKFRATFITWHADAGIQFISYQENIDTTSPLGQALFTIVSAVAQLERDLIRERVNAGIRHARACGKQLGRPRRTVDSDEIVRLKDEGASLREIAKKLGIGYGTVRQRLWRADTSNRKKTQR